MTDDLSRLPDIIYVRGYEKRKNNCGTWSIYNEPHTKWGPTGNVKGTHIRQKYVCYDTAHKKAEGAQVLKLLTEIRDEIWAGPEGLMSGRLEQLIDKADEIIQAGAKEKE